MPEQLAHLSPTVAHTLLSVWWFVFGSCVGSFLNVVVYRVPAGLSIATPPSHCPHCKTPIRWHDNVPILGWLLLGGRCRACQAPIAKRYPLVELVTGLLFLAVGQVIALSGGGFASVLQAWGAALFFLMLVCTLWSAALVEYDGQVLPARGFLPAAALGLIGPLGWPFLVGAASIASALGAMIVGGAVGAVTGRVVVAAGRGGSSSGLQWGVALVGLYLGWPAAAAIGLAMLPLAAYRRLRGGRAGLPMSGWLAAAALLWILCVRPLCGG